MCVHDCVWTIWTSMNLMLRTRDAALMDCIVSVHRREVPLLPPIGGRVGMTVVNRVDKHHDILIKVRVAQFALRFGRP